LYVGQRLDGAAGLLHRPPMGKAWQWVAGVSLMAIQSLKSIARLSNTFFAIKRN
jgi:hypothetical protein